MHMLQCQTQLHKPAEGTHDATGEVDIIRPETQTETRTAQLVNYSPVNHLILGKAHFVLAVDPAKEIACNRQTSAEEEGKGPAQQFYGTDGKTNFCAQPESKFSQSATRQHLALPPSQ